VDETVTSHHNQDESLLPRSTNANCYEAEPTSHRPCGNSPPTRPKPSQKNPEQLVPHR